MQVVTAYIGLGANLGSPRAQIAAALAGLEATPGIEVTGVSKLRETEPVDAPLGSPGVLNGVAQLRVKLPAVALLGVCQALEAQAGRVRGRVPNAPRPLDLDVLLYGEERVDRPELVVPHPRMLQREFVLQPLREFLDAGAIARLGAQHESPFVARSSSAMSAATTAWRSAGCTVGLVPTMGALHAGHASLLAQAREECDRVVATIFVNPLQFAAGEDLDSYPRTWDADLEIARDQGVDAIFVPTPDAMYPQGFCSEIAVGAESAQLEGATRPIHFSGVVTVVAKLFNLVQPTHAYFGQKDAQQVAVLRRMATDLSYPLTLRIAPIVREPDGLAMSSRNVRLSAPDREAALVLARGLRSARARCLEGETDPEALLAIARAEILREHRVELDYLELREDPGLTPVGSQVTPRARMLVAAWLGGDASNEDAARVRLIDNMAMGGEVE